jgi:4-amino-4-deoxy-L-arabinose transferase-like glycosyltransferase
MRRLYFAFLILVATVFALYLALRQPAPERFDAGTPGDAYTLINFYAPEQDQGTTYRWSGRGAALLLAGSFGGPRQLALRLQANAAQPDQTLTVRRDEEPLAMLTLAPGWRVYRVLLPPANERNPPGQQPLWLDIPTARPGPADLRDLGAALDWAELAPIAPDTSAQPLLEALRLSWLLALLAVAAAIWNRALPAHAKPLPIASVAGPLAAAGAGLVAWAYFAPTILSWALPVSYAWLAIASAGLLAVGLLAHFRTRQGDRGRGGQGVTTAVANDETPLVPLSASSASGPVPPSPAHRLSAIGYALALHLLLLPLFPPVLRGSAAVLLLWLPGALIAGALFAGESDGWERAFIGICGGAVCFALLLFGLQALPGPPPWWLLLLIVDALIIGALWRKGHPSPRPAHPYGRVATGLYLILALAAILRLWNLGAGEFQGDEARATLLANGLHYGYEGILLSHTKGPVEALLPAGPLVLAGQLTEFAARLPFALAGLGVVLGAFVLARRLFASFGPTIAERAGLAAALLLATDGLLIGFSRIVQYQSIVMLCMVGALWCCWRFFSSRPQGFINPKGLDGEGSIRDLLGAAVLLAVGLLAHYDAAAVVPALVWLVLWGGWRQGWRGAVWLRKLWLPVLVGGGLLASFYGPFVLSERFGRTAEYLAGRTGEGDAGGFLFNNLPLYFNLLTVYNTTFQVYAAWAILVLGLAFWQGQRTKNSSASDRSSPFSVLSSWLSVLSSAFLVLSSLINATQPNWLQLPNGLNLALFGFGLPLAVLIAHPEHAAGTRAALLFFTVPFLAMGFVIAEPRTHFYTMHIGGALLVSIIMVRVVGTQHAASLRRATLFSTFYPLLSIFYVLLTVPYLDLAFLRLFPEYRRTFPAARPALYRSAYGDTLPEGGYFGFPRRDGWKAIAQLYAAGELRGSYDASQSGFLTGWYMRGIPQCKSEPDYFFVSLIEEQQYIPPAYYLAGELSIGPLRTIDIYAKEPVAEVRRYQLAPAIDPFDAASVPDFALGPALDELTPRVPLDVAWQAGARLRGYDLSSTTPSSNAPTNLILYWQAGAPLSREVTPLLLLRDSSGATVRELRPSCADHPATLWTARYVSPVQFSLNTAELPPGTYTLHAALRDGDQTLPLRDGAPDALLTTVQISPGS